MTSLERVPTDVPIQDGQEVVVDPGDPWPSAYRGSKYSLISSRKHHQLVMAWQYDDLQLFFEPPSGLFEALRDIGKRDGKGSVVITAGREVLTKVEADRYDRLDRAPVSDGWILTYVGKLRGEPTLDGINVNPKPPKNPPVAVWEGFPFNHGETWSVSAQNELLWIWEGRNYSYRFQSAFDHPELIQRYREYRQPPGRVYVTEFGHIWVNIPPDSVPETRSDEINTMYAEWKREANRAQKSAIQRLVRRRLEATGDGNTEDGQLPVHLGRVDRFDDGLIPCAIVDDNRYFVEASRRQEMQ